MCLQIIYLIRMYSKDLALNKLQWLICHKTKLNEMKLNQISKTEVYANAV